MDSSALTRYQIGIVILCALITMIDGFDTQAIAFVAPEIARFWGIPIAQFGPVFGAGLLGGMVGALGFGVAADRFGRKPGLLIAMGLFGAASVATPLANSMGELIALRVITGIGLGGALPSVIALTSEYAPARLRATLVTSMFCGFPLGAAIGAAASAWAIPAYGWQSILVMGGLIPMALIPLVAWIVPESIHYLVTQGKYPRAQQILARMHLQLQPNPAAEKQQPRPKHSTITALFSEGRAAGTLLLWLIFFLSLLMTYFLINWTPSIVNQAGLAFQGAVVAVAMLNIGGVFGCVLLGRLIDKFGPYGVIACGYAIGAFAIAAIGYAGTSMVLVLAAAFITGFFSIGAQMCVVALVASFYSTALRATGVGWAMGMGRIGAIVGPVAGGLLVAAGLGAKALFLFVAAVSLLAAGSALVMGLARPRAVASAAFSN
jgi:AAHS family 4-hydroxybenzoate transporter-like MFS transporter